jgi:hypothetical protein
MLNVDDWFELEFKEDEDELKWNLHPVDSSDSTGMVGGVETSCHTRLPTFLKLQYTQAAMCSLALSLTHSLKASLQCPIMKPSSIIISAG